MHQWEAARRQVGWVQSWPQSISLSVEDAISRNKVGVDYRLGNYLPFLLHFCLQFAVTLSSGQEPPPPPRSAISCHPHSQGGIPRALPFDCSWDSKWDPQRPEPDCMVPEAVHSIPGREQQMSERKRGDEWNWCHGSRLIRSCQHHCQAKYVHLSVANRLWEALCQGNAHIGYWQQCHPGVCCTLQHDLIFGGIVLIWKQSWLKVWKEGDENWHI